jgi:membrane-bound lytic murein transglycosylase A
MAALLFVQACACRQPGPPATGQAGPPPAPKGLVVFAPALPSGATAPGAAAPGAGTPASAAPGSAAGGAAYGSVPAQPDWRDDSTSDSLAQAVTQSLNYYRTIPPDTPFPIGGVTYTAAEMAASLELFLALRMSTPDPDAFAALLRQKFAVYESSAENGDNLFTGYYQPRIRGSLTPTAELSAPLYARPGDLVELALEDFGKDLPKRKVVGRVQDGRLVPYYSREQIQQGGLQGRAEPIAYVNEVDLFFLQIQGSGLVVLPDGRILAVGYEASNGQPYRSLGAELIRRNLMAREEVNLVSLRRYLAEHKELTSVLLNTNPSYVFFRKLGDERGPLGSVNVPLTPGRSLAADRGLLPAGALAYVMTTVPVPNEPGQLRDVRRFMLIQDTGGAIRGHGRGDLFWGEGADAEWMAGHAKQPGRLFLLVARKDALPPPAAFPARTADSAPRALGRTLQTRLP